MNFQELLAAVAARSSTVDPSNIPAPIAPIDLASPDLYLHDLQNGAAGQPQNGMPQYGAPHPFNITQQPYGAPQQFNITQYPQYNGMSPTIMPVAVPIRQGLGVGATLLLATAFGTLVALVIFLLLRGSISGGPAIGFVEPVSGSTVAPGEMINLSVTANESMGHVGHVDFYYESATRGRQFIVTAIAPPYSCTWNTMQVGDYILDAVATDDHGVTSTAQTTIHVAPPMPVHPVAVAPPIQPVTPQPAPAVLPTAAVPAPLTKLVPLATVTAVHAVPLKPLTSPVKKIKPIAAAKKPVKAAVLHAVAKVSHIRRARVLRAPRARARIAPLVAKRKPVKAAVKKVTQSSQFHVTALVSPRRENADRLAAALRKRGYNVYSHQVHGSWVVETPAFKSKNDAAAAAKQLKKSGYNVGLGTQ